MDYLSLCQRLRMECGISGSGPTAVTGQTGEYSRVVTHIAQAWQDIQTRRPNWHWMRGSFQFNASVGDGTYSTTDAGISTTFAAWKTDSFRNWNTATGSASEMFMGPMPYDEFRDHYLFGSQRTTQGQPLHLAVVPSDKSLLLGPLPDQTYTVAGEYYKLPTVLAANTDEPNMPARFHMSIVYRAMMMYGRYENAPEVFADAENNFKRAMLELEMDQLPVIEIGGTLA